jgi:hypothetical protein
MDIQDLRRKISTSKNVTLQDSKSVIEKGYLSKHSGEEIEYSIEHGLNINSAIACDQSWDQFKLEMLDYIEQQNYSEEKLSEVLSGIQTEDYHWNWALKSHICSTTEYEWFFLFADNQPQGACLIYHPKKSTLHPNNIFYVEFVAVAPWNRSNPYKPKMFTGVGSVLIKSALNYAVNILGLYQGFSLHSLPQACDYYIKIGMLNDKNHNKDGLEYFEMPEAIAKKMLGAS